MRVNVLLPVGLILTLALGSVVGCGNNPAISENGATLAPAGQLALSEVPTKVLEAANKAVPGGEVKDVETEVEDGELLFCITVAT